MGDKNSTVFVRAKPEKIAVEERYYYHMDIGHNTATKFQRAEGEIRLEYPYDGKEFFDEDALEDTKHQRKDEGPLQATVGYLSVRGHQSTTWAEALNRDTLTIVLPVDHAEGKIECSQKCVLRYKYGIAEPASPPVVVNATLIDEEPIPVGISRTSFEDRMRLRLLIEAQLAGVRRRAEAELEEQVWRLMEQGEGEGIGLLPPSPNGEELARTLVAMANGRGGHIIIGGVRDGREPGLTDNELEKAQATLRDAVMSCTPPVPIVVPRPVSIGERFVLFTRIPPDLSDAYQLNNTYFRREGTTNRPLSADEANRLRSQRVGARLREPLWAELFSAEEVAALLARAPGTTLSFIWEEEDMTPERLAETIVALANTQGGYILIGVQPQRAGGPGQARGLEEPRVKEIIGRVTTVAEKCHPPVTISGLQQITRDGKTIVAVRISSDLPYVYSTDGRVLGRREAQNEPLSTDEIYKRLIERSPTETRELLDVTRPMVTYARLDWPYIPHITEAARFDPEKKVVEWQHLEMKQEDEDHYRCEMPIPVEQPKELYRQREIRGEIHLRCSDLTLSGLRVDYFNALGEGRKPARAPYGSPSKSEDASRPRNTKSTAASIEHSATVVVDIAISVDSVFPRREFFPYRHIELEGVIPEPNRLDDVLNALNDLGIRIAEVEPAPASDDKAFLAQIGRGFRITGVKHTGAEQTGVKHVGAEELEVGPADLEVGLVVRGTKGRLIRQVELGRRTDKLQLETGKLVIDIFGRVQGDFKRLSALLGEIQQVLKDRLESVRVT